MSTAKRRLSDEAERVNPIQPVHIWRTPPGSVTDVIIVTHLEAYRVIHDHSVAALPDETGGFLIGRVSCDQRDGCWHVEIEEAIPVTPESQDPVHFTFTWRDVDRIRTYREGAGKALVGWYHTHPGLDIFLSDTDLERTHRVLFAEPFQVALVYDPSRGRAGYFHWEGPQQLEAQPALWREFDIVVADGSEVPDAAAEASSSDHGTVPPTTAPRLTPLSAAPSERLTDPETAGPANERLPSAADAGAPPAGVASPAPMGKARRFPWLFERSR